MYCAFCGKQIPEDSRFCPQCGKTVRTVEAVVRSDVDRSTSSSRLSENTGIMKGPHFLRITLALVLIVGSVISNFFGMSSERLQELYELVFALPGDGAYQIAVISAIRTFYDFLKPLFYFAFSAISLVCGIALLQNRGNARRYAAIAAVVNIFTALYAGIVLLLTHWATGWVISLFLHDNAGIQFIRDNPVVLSVLGKEAVVHFFAGILMAAISIVLLVVFKKNTYSVQVCEKRPVSGIIILLVCMGILAVIKNLYVNTLLLPALGSYVLSAFPQMQDVISVTILPLFCFIALCIVLAMSFDRIKNPMPSLAPLALLVVLAVVFGIYAPLRAQELGVIEQSFELVQSFVNSEILETTLIMASVCVWLTAAAKGKIPLFLQIFLTIAIIVLYPLGAYMRFLVLRMFFLPAGGIAVALVIGVPAILCLFIRSGKKRKMKTCPPLC